MDSNYIQGLRGLHAEHAHQQDGLLLVPLQGAGGRRQGVQQGRNSTHLINMYHKIIDIQSPKNGCTWFREISSCCCLVGWNETHQTIVTVV